jgi:hypothetical protein
VGEQVAELVRLPWVATKRGSTLKEGVTKFDVLSRSGDANSEKSEPIEIELVRC